MINPLMTAPRYTRVAAMSKNVAQVVVSYEANIRIRATSCVLAAWFITHSQGKRPPHISGQEERRLVFVLFIV